MKRSPLKAFPVEPNEKAAHPHGTPLPSMFFIKASQMTYTHRNTQIPEPVSPKVEQAYPDEGLISVEGQDGSELLLTEGEYLQVLIQLRSLSPVSGPAARYLDQEVAQ